MQVALTTYKDLIDHGIDFLGANVSGEAARDVRRSILSAYRDLANEHSWTYYYARGRLNTVAIYNTGTVQFQVSSGTVPFQVTLSGGTWPSWAGLGTIMMNNIAYEVAQRIDNVTLQLTAQTAPAADVPAGATYTLYQDVYPLPVDFLAADEVINSTYVLALEYVHPNAWLARQRLVRGPAVPYVYTFTSEPRYFGSLAIRFFPAPDQVYAMDFVYKRRPRAMLYDQITAGTVVVNQGSLSVAGSGTAWTSKLVGSALRFSADGTNVPTGPEGSNPAAYERIITGVTSATILSIDASLPETLNNVKYLISDPADVEAGAMLTALLRGVEKQVGRTRNMKDRTELANAYLQAVLLAKEADARSFQRRVAGVEAPLRMRLAYMPKGPDVS